jgi:hypothetical protein
MAARSQAWVCGRSLVEIVCSYPAESMNVSLFWVLCVVKQRALRRADHTSRGVYRVGCVWVWSSSLDNEEALPHCALMRNLKKKSCTNSTIIHKFTFLCCNSLFISLLMYFMFCWPCILISFVMKTNQMHYLSLIYFANQPLHVSGMYTAHHQAVFTVYSILTRPAASQLKRITRTNCCTYTVHTSWWWAAYMPEKCMGYLTK